MIKTSAIVLSSLLALSFASLPKGEGQGTAKPGSNLSGLRAGTHITGPKLMPNSLRGKVVVVKIGGS